jgi:cell wall assembly regulator SMI1
MTNVSASWRMIEDVLRENAHSVFVALRKPATDAQLRRLANKLDVELPKDFVQSWKIHDGLRDSFLGQIRLFNFWAFLPLSAIQTVWKTMTDLQAECGFGGCQFEVTPRIKNDAHWRVGWVPFMDADGDKVVIDLDPGPRGKVGQVFEWSNSGSFPMRLLADSFGDWLSGVAERFSKRRFRLDEFGAIWLDDESR